jgi:hypothetical protein
MPSARVDHGRRIQIQPARVSRHVSLACPIPPRPALIKEAGKIPGLLGVLALVPDPQKRRGRRFGLVFILAVAVACALAEARTFREAEDHAADLPQNVLAQPGGRPHPLLQRITAPSETRIRTLVHANGADFLDDLISGWLRALADAGRPDGLLTAIAIDGKWLHGVLLAFPSFP